MILLVPMWVGADERPVCRMDAVQRDRYGCVPFSYVQKDMRECRWPLSFCFTLTAREWPPRNSLIVHAQGPSVEVARGKAQSICDRMMQQGIYEGCRIGRVERRDAPGRLTLEVVSE